MLSQVFEPRAHLFDHLQNVPFLFLPIFILRIIAVLKHVSQVPALAVFRNDIKEAIVLLLNQGLPEMRPHIKRCFSA